MKSQVNASPQRSCLASRSWWRFSPTSVDPGLGERLHLLERHVLGRGEDLDVRAAALADPLEVGAHDRAGRCRGSASGIEPDQPGLAPGAPGVAAVGEEELRLAARAEPARLDRVDARPRRAVAGRPRAGRASARPRPHRRDRRSARAPRRRPRSSTGRSRVRSRPRWRRPRRPRGRRSRRPGRASRSAASPRRARPRARPAGSRRPGRAASALGSRSPGRRHPRRRAVGRERIRLGRALAASHSGRVHLEAEQDTARRRAPGPR